MITYTFILFIHQPKWVSRVRFVRPGVSRNIWGMRLAKEENRKLGGARSPAEEIWIWSKDWKASTWRGDFERDG